MKSLLLSLIILLSFSAFGQPTIAWQKCLGGSWYDYAYSIQQTTDGGYIVAGEAQSYVGDVSGNNGSMDYWVVKLGPYIGINEPTNTQKELIKIIDFMGRETEFKPNTR